MDIYIISKIEEKFSTTLDKVLINGLNNKNNQDFAMQCSGITQQDKTHVKSFFQS